MSATSFESAVAAVARVLDEHLSGVRVVRSRVDPLSADELPAVRVQRAQVDVRPHGGTLLRADIDVSLTFYVAPGDESETQLDALHARAHDVLITWLGAELPDARSLSFLGTDNPDEEAGEITLARMRASYRITTLVAERDLAHHR